MQEYEYVYQDLTGKWVLFNRLGETLMLEVLGMMEITVNNVRRVCYKVFRSLPEGASMGHIYPHEIMAIVKKKNEC